VTISDALPLEAATLASRFWL